MTYTDVNFTSTTIEEDNLNQVMTNSNHLRAELDVTHLGCISAGLVGTISHYLDGVFIGVNNWISALDISDLSVGVHTIRSKTSWINIMPEDYEEAPHIFVPAGEQVVKWFRAADMNYLTIQIYTAPFGFWMGGEHYATTITLGGMIYAHRLDIEVAV